MLEEVVKFVFSIVLNLVFYVILYWSGWLILRILTLGNYPPPQSRQHNRIFVSGIALVTLLIVIATHSL
jgi:hypothetical protein